jgi:SAM-dependent methyltransferase
MLCGADQYYALDRMAFACSKSNIAILDELVALLRDRSPIPDDLEFPGVFPKLDTYEFPTLVLDDAWLDRCLATTRVELIRRAVAGDFGGDSKIQLRYFAPWDESSAILAESVDWVFSQAVLEHVDNAQGTYENLTKWLRPGGLMSHTIDYSSHGLTRDWNGHWSVGHRMWRIARGRRPYLINRLPHSVHMQMIRACGCRIATEIKVSREVFDQATVAPSFKCLTECDISTASAFVVAVKTSNTVSSDDDNYLRAKRSIAFISQRQAKQRVLPQMAIDAFDTPEGTAEQLQHFKTMLGYTHESVFSLLDVGGGTGFFASAVQNEFPHAAITILDLDESSVRKGIASGLNALHGSIINPPTEIRGKTFDVVSFNLMLHHIIGDDEPSTYELQRRALEQGLKLMSNEGKMFVHEICYEGRLLRDLSARLIYGITSSRFIGAAIRVMGKAIAALSANTAGIGVRFRPSHAWMTLASKAGLSLVSGCKGEPEQHSWMRTLFLLIREVRRHSWVMSSAQDNYKASICPTTPCRSDQKM